MQLINLTKNELNHTGHAVYKCARVAGHTKKFVFQWFNSCYRPFVFHLCTNLYNFLVCKIISSNLYVINMFYVVSVRYIYIYVAMSGFNVRLVNV